MEKVIVSPFASQSANGRTTNTIGFLTKVVIKNLTAFREVKKKN